jgi:hypothetical protein
VVVSDLAKETPMQAAKAEQTLIELETRFWQSMVDQDTETALSLLHEPALMVSSHGAMKFDHAGYRKMAEQGSMVLKSFQLGDVDVVFPSDRTAVMTYRVKQGVGARGDTHERIEEMADTSTWVRDDDNWRCVMHTETPVPGSSAGSSTETSG